MSEMNLSPSVIASLTHAESAYATLNPVGTEMAPNNGFETDMSGWSVSSATGVRTTAQAHSGIASLQVTATAAFPTIATAAQITVTAGVSYRFSMWSKAATTARQTYPQFLFYDANFALIGSALQPSSGFVTNTTTGWTQTLITTGFTAPTGAVRMLPQILVNNAAVGEVHYFDDISISAAVLNTIIDKNTLTPMLAGKADLVSGVVPLSQLPSNIGSGGSATDINTFQNIGIVSRGVSEKPLIIGGSGASIPGTQPGLVALWMNRATWDDLYGAQYLYASAGYQAAKAANSYINADIGIPLIPHGMAQSQWNALLDLAGSNGAVTLGNGTATTTDAIYTNYGKSLSDQAPVNGTLYARVWWEFNLNPDANNIDRTKFITAWNRAIPLIRQGFAAQSSAQSRPNQAIKIVFCPISDGQDFTTFWPDPANVDLVAMDIYDCIWTSTAPTQSQLRTYIAGKLKLINDFAVLKNKPCAMGEWGCWTPGSVDGSTYSRGFGDDPAFIDQVFDFAEANNWTYLSYYNIAALGPNVYLYDSTKPVTQQTDLPLSLERYMMRSAGKTMLVGLDPLTGLLPEGYIPTRLTATALNAAYAPIAGTPVKMAVLGTPYNTSGQPMVAFGQAGTAGGSIAFSATGTENDDGTFYTVTPGTLDTTTAANNVAGSITPLKPGVYNISVGLGIQTNTAGQNFSISLAFGGTAIASDTVIPPTANSGYRHTFTVPYRISAADVTAGKKLTVFIYSAATFTVVCGIGSDTFMRVVYLGS